MKVHSIHGNGRIIRQEIVALAIGWSLALLLSACALPDFWRSRTADDAVSPTVVAPSVRPASPTIDGAESDSAESDAQEDITPLPVRMTGDDVPGTIVSRELVATWRVSQGPDASPSNGPASDVAMSVDGRYIAFTSSASNLAPGDENGHDDVYLYDGGTRNIRLISANPDGVAGDGWSSGPAVSADGRYVAFYSWASDLAPGDFNAVQDIFVFDRIGGTIERVSIAPDGAQANDRSGDSRSGARPAISADGRVIAFHSQASNLINQDTNQDTNRAQDVFVFDRGLRRMTRVSVSSHGAQGSGDSHDPALSANGRYVAFSSQAKNLDLYHPNPAGVSQIFVHDRVTGATQMISVGIDGVVGNGDSGSPALSGNGRTLVFSSVATNLVGDDTNDAADIFLYNLQSDEMQRVSVNSAGRAGNGDSVSPAISLEGQYVGYASAATNLVNGDTNSAVDIFVYDRLTRHTGRASVGVIGPWKGVEADDDSHSPPAISAGGRLVTFVSIATNLVAGETGQTAEVYALERSDLPTHTIRGRILDGKNRPVSGISIVAGPHQAVTGDDGRYSLEHVAGGTYTLTPSGEGVSFAPTRRTVSVVTDIHDADFTGLTNGGAPLAFLTLPLGNIQDISGMLLALRDTDEGGWVDAWFDHDAPDYAKNGVVSLWDGRERSNGLYNSVLGCYERRCYDGHDGTDFPYRDPNPATKAYEPLLIRAAAPGNVADIVTGCESGDRWCNGGYGNEVIVNHGNGFFTRYSHLASEGGIKQLTLSTSVDEEDVLGAMGSTGNSFGAHLHFAVHQDDGNGRWDGEKQDLPVDPFGWSGIQPDPWARNADGPVSRWMWNEHPTVERLLFGSHGATLRDLTGAVTVTVPPGALSGQIRLELDPSASVAIPEDGMRGLGNTFSLQVLDWYPPAGQNATNAELAEAILASPIEIAMGLDNVDTLHMDMDRAKVQRWDAGGSRWQSLPTMIAKDGMRVDARSDRLGIFDLQAPLLCSGDPLEPDDSYYAATYIEPGDKSLHRLFDLEEDEDWVRFDALRGQGIHVRVDDIADGVIVETEIYGLDGLTPLAAAESVDGRPVQLAWSPPDDGTYFVRVAPTQESSVGCNATYSISVD